MAYDLVLSGAHYRMLRAHLLPSDGQEAAAILLCRNLMPLRQRLIVAEALLVPYDECGLRARDAISWPGGYLSNAIDRAEDENFTIILIHSHPGGFFDFSSVDDDSDLRVISSLHQGWCGDLAVAGHGSAIMAGGEGRIRARLYGPELIPEDISCVTVVGDDIQRWEPVMDESPKMAFGRDMTSLLAELHACVIGVSGTGSIIVEQAARMGFGELTLIDFDHVEHKNLNRILNSTAADAATKTLKTDVFRRALKGSRPDLKPVSIPKSILSRDAVLAAASADIIFCCVDSAEGRQVADLVAQAFLIPLIDMGVTIPTRATRAGGRAIADVVGRIDYVQPFGSSLADRQVFTPASLRAEYLARVDPECWEAERKEGYIRGAPNEAPSVIALNMRAASAAMLEYIARLMPFRHDDNRGKARTLFELGAGEETHISEDDFTLSGPGIAARGLAEPLLGLPSLAA